MSHFILRYLLVFFCLATPLVTSCAHHVQCNENKTSHKKGIAPQALNKQLIVLDPGHGGSDKGATLQKIQEKNLSLKTAVLVKRYLNEKGYRVVLTRSRDIFLPLSKRTHIANRTKSALFVSIHYNAFKSSQVEGIEVYYYNKGPKWRQSRSKKLAQCVLDGMIMVTQAKNRGIKPGNFYVIRETQMPAILIEGGFITHPQEHVHLSNQKYIETLAHSIADGIETYCSAF